MPHSTTVTTSQASNSFASLAELGANVRGLKEQSQGGSKPVTVKVAGCSFKVDFRNRKVTEGFCQRLRRCFDYCRGRKHNTTGDVYKQLFQSVHLTSPETAFWVLANQAARERAMRSLEGAARADFPTVTRPGQAPDLSHIQLEAFSTLGIGAYGIAEDTMAGNSAGPLWVWKRPREMGRAAFLAFELEQARNLRHPNIIHYEPALYNGTDIVMEHGGVPLFNLCTQPSMGLGREAFVDLLVQLLQGLVYLHDNNIVHRDIKAANILVDPQTRQLRIADFGLAMHLGATGCCQQDLGSSNYLAPEVILGQPHRTEPDIYSAGDLLYFMCTGEALNPIAEYQRGQYIVPAQTICERVEQAVEGLCGFTASEKKQMMVLMMCMLKHKPEERITAREALELVRTNF